MGNRIPAGIGRNGIGFVRYQRSLCWLYFFNQLQEALIRAWSKRGQFDPERGTPSAWLLAITADQARRARRGRRPLLGMLPGRVTPIDDELDLAHAITGLSSRQRLAVDCFYFVGLDVAETAAVMRCSQGTVKSTLSDARIRLRKLLEGRDGPA